MLEHRPILITEIFGPTIQGEGAQIGRPTVFVRTGGCDYRCSWCDTPFAVQPRFKAEWLPKTAAEIVAEVERLTDGAPILVTLSGGNPALQPLEPLIDLLHARGHTVTMETQGSIARPWFRKLDHLTISPKPPSSGMQPKIDRLLDALDAGPDDTSLKVVVFDDTDYQFAREIGEIAESAGAGVRMFLSVGNPTPEANDANITGLLARLLWLVDKVCTDRWTAATVLPQLHTLLWGNRRGV